METKKIGTYDLDILELKEFKKYYYDHKDYFTTTAFNSFLKTVDIPAKFFKEQPETTQDELLDNREVFVREKKKYLDKVIIVLRADDKILNACRLKKEEFNILYPKLKKIDEVPNKFEHRSFYKDGYITYVISEDLIVPRSNLTKMIYKCNEVSAKYNLKMCLVAHFGDGNLHPQFALNMNNETEFRNYQSAKSEIYDYVIKLGGTISAEHGVGLEKKDIFQNNIDQNALEYMKLVKKAFDPKNILNPGKIFEL